MEGMNDLIWGSMGDECVSPGSDWFISNTYRCWETRRGMQGLVLLGDI